MSNNAMGDSKVCLLETAAPPFSNDAEFFPGMDKQWGLSFMINNEEAPTGRSPGSLAWAGLANTYYWIDQKKGVGGVYATQVLPFADVKSLPLFYAFEGAVYGRLQAESSDQQQPPRPHEHERVRRTRGPEEHDRRAACGLQRCNSAGASRNWMLLATLVSGSDESSCSTKRCCTPARKRGADDLFHGQDAAADFHRRAVRAQVLQVHEHDPVRAVLQVLDGVLPRLGDPVDIELELDVARVGFRQQQPERRRPVGERRELEVVIVIGEHEAPAASGAPDPVQHPADFFQSSAVLRSAASTDGHTR